MYHLWHDSIHYSNQYIHDFPGRGRYEQPSTPTEEVAHGLFIAFTTGSMISFAARIFTTGRPRSETWMVRGAGVASFAGVLAFLFIQGFSSLSALSSIGIYSVFGVFPPIAITFAAVALVQYIARAITYVRYLAGNTSKQETEHVIKHKLQYQGTLIGLGIGTLTAIICVLVFLLVSNPFGGIGLAICVSVLVCVGCASFGSHMGDMFSQDISYKPTPQKPHEDAILADQQLDYALSDNLEHNGQRLTKIHTHKVRRYRDDVTNNTALLTCATLDKHVVSLGSFNTTHPDTIPELTENELDTLTATLEDIDCIAQAVIAVTGKPISDTGSAKEMDELEQEKNTVITTTNWKLEGIKKQLTRLTATLDNTITPANLNNATSQRKRQLARLQQQLQHVTFDIKQAKKSETTPPVPGKHGLAQSYGGWLNLPNYFFSSIYASVSLCRKRFGEILWDGQRKDLLDEHSGNVRWLSSPCFPFVALAEGICWAFATVVKALTTLTRHPKTGIAIVLFIAALALFSNPISATFTLIALAAIVTSTLLVFIDYQAQTAKHAELESFRPDHDVESSPTTISPGDIEQLIAVIQHFGPDIQQQTSYCFTRDLEILQGIQRQQHIQLQKHLSTSLNNDKRYEVYQIQKNLRRGIACLDTNHLHLWRNIGIAIFAALLLAGGLFLLFSPAAPASMLLLYSGFKITALLIAGVGIAGIVGGAQQALQIYQQQELLADVSPNSGLEVGGSSYSQIAIQQRGAKIERKYGQHTPVVPDHKSFISVVSGSTHHHLLNGHNANGGGSTPSSPEIEESVGGRSENISQSTAPFLSTFHQAQEAHKTPSTASPHPDDSKLPNNSGGGTPPI